MPVTIETPCKIKQAGDHQPPGSALSTLHQDLHNPNGLGLLNIQVEEERWRRGQQSRNHETLDVLWERFRSQVFTIIWNVNLVFVITAKRKLQIIIITFSICRLSFIKIIQTLYDFL